MENEILPEGWKRELLGNLLIEPIKKPIKKSEYSKSELLTVKLHLKGISNTGKFPNWTPHGRPYFRRKFGELLVGRQNFHNGGFGIVPKELDGLIASNAISSFVSKENCDIWYIYYSLSRDYLHKRFDSLMEGTGQKEISVYKFFSIDIPLPPLPEQRKIAEILSTVDRAIEKTDQIIEKYKRIKRGLTQDLLTKGIDENGRIRSEETHRFWDSPLGRIPEEWEMVHLEKIADVMDCKHKTPKYTSNGYPVILPQNIANGKINIQDAPRTTYNEFLELTEKYSPKKGDLILTRNAKIGEIGFVNFDTKFAIGQDLVGIRPKDQCNSKFLYYVFMSTHISSQVDKVLTGSTFERINLTFIRRLMIPRPPLPEQRRIAKILSQIDRVIEEEQKYKEKLERLKRGLMEDLLSGKVRTINLIGGLESES